MGKALTILKLIHFLTPGQHEVFNPLIQQQFATITTVYLLMNNTSWFSTLYSYAFNVVEHPWDLSSSCWLNNSSYNHSGSPTPDSRFALLKLRRQKNKCSCSRETGKSKVVCLEDSPMVENLLSITKYYWASSINSNYTENVTMSTLIRVIYVSKHVYY